LSQLLADLEKLVAPELEAEQIELVDLSYQKSQGGWTLAFFLDKPGGITLDDCQRWSHRLGAIIDEGNLIERSYVLEVSSPGLDRPLRKTSDFQRFAGQRVDVRLYGPLNGQRNFHGVLLRGDEEKICVRLEDGREVDLPRSQVAKCRLNPVIEI
jgi:ribosome maturation factor RimP